jgi:hypothetical protein
LLYVSPRIYSDRIELAEKQRIIAAVLIIANILLDIFYIIAIGLPIRHLLSVISAAGATKVTKEADKKSTIYLNRVLYASLIGSSIRVPTQIVLMFFPNTYSYIMPLSYVLVAPSITGKLIFQLFLFCF